MSKSCNISLVLVVFVQLWFHVPLASAAGYDFVVLASSTEPVQPQPLAPSIDQTGAVSFLGSGAGGPKVLVATEPGGSSFEDYLVIEERPGIMSLGTFRAGFVAYQYLDFVTPDSSIIARGNGGPPQVLYMSSDVLFPPPAVNAGGQLAAFSQPTSAASLLFVEDMVPTTLFQEGQTLGDGSVIADISGVAAADIDDLGRVAFLARFLQDGCDGKVLLSGLAVPSEIATGGLASGCSFFQAEHSPLALNNSGSVAYSGTFFPTEDLAFGVFVDGTLVWDSRAEGFRGAVLATAVALNNTGTVAYLLQGTERHIYVGSDPVADRVIGQGDSLCGGTVASVDFQRYGLNDANELAIWVSLGQAGFKIIRAQPSTGPGGACITTTDPVPEPGGAFGALAAIASLAALRAKCKSKILVS